MIKTEVLDRPGRAVWGLGISAAAYRNRLERARGQVREALRGRRGLLDPTEAVLSLIRSGRYQGLI